MNGEDDEDLERVKTFKGGIGWISWIDKGGEVDETTASQLCIAELRSHFFLQ